MFIKFKGDDKEFVVGDDKKLFKGNSEDDGDLSKDKGVNGVFKSDDDLNVNFGVS